MSDRTSKYTHIEHTLDALRKAWIASPELRLGQLLCNAFPAVESNLFYVSDDLLGEALREYRGVLGDRRPS